MKPFLFSLCSIIMNIGLAQHAIIPIPVQYQSKETNFVLKNEIRLEFDGDNRELETISAQLEEWLRIGGIKTKNGSENRISLVLNEQNDVELGQEGYQLEVNLSEILINANTPAGLFYGIQTLKQLMPAGFGVSGASSDSIVINGCLIRDFPRFKWRGLMLDVSRHFFTVEEVKAFIDKMVEYKFNTFHWHLSDDQGWRIEIKSHPKLTEIGAWRVERKGRFGSHREPPKPGEAATYGGFYTQEDIREVVRYAAERNVSIVPEIDVPGHCMALLAAYPELSTQQEPKFVDPGIKFAEWYGDGTFKMFIENTLNPADEQVYTFLDEVFTEVANLFPGPYIHMGGDECYKGYWEASDDVKAFMKENELEDSHALQSYFVGRVGEIIASKGKKMVGWDEIMEGGLPEDAVVMSWQGIEGGIKAAKAGLEAVMSPTDFCYLDYTQGDHSVENPIYRDLSLETCYKFDPLPDGVDPAFILGGQGNLWTEVVPSLQFAYYMAYPRAFALAECLWSPRESKNWNSFIARTEQHFLRFEATQANICKAVYEPIVEVYRESGRLMCRLENHVPGVEMFYTVDNTYPLQFGTKYQGPFVIPEGKLSLRAQSFRVGMPLGRMLILDREELERRMRD